MEKTLEEAAELYLENVNTKVHKDLERDGWMKIGFIGGAKWQAERSYSEGEVLEILKLRLKWFGIVLDEFEDNKWFKQFKKK